MKLNKMTRAALAGLLGVVLTATVGTAVQSHQAPPASVAVSAAQTLPPLEGPVEIMVTGDSIAAGFPNVCPDGTPFGDRWALGDWFKVAKLDVRFVGSVQSSCVVPYNRYEARSGETIRGLADRIGGYLAANPADILIVRVGVNDATSHSQWRTAAQMSADMLRLIDNARAQIPTIRILVSKIISPNGSRSDDLARASVTVQEFNLGLRQLVAPYGDAVHIGEFDMIATGPLGDGLHPNNDGYFLIAYVTYNQPDGVAPWLSSRPLPRTDSAFIKFNLWGSR